MPNIADLLDELLDRIDGFAAATTRRIRAEMPGYANVPFAQHREDVRNQLLLIINGLVVRQPAAPDAIEQVRALGRRRAQQQLTLPEFVGAYHIAFREIWNELLLAAGRHEPDLTADLAREVSLIWSWFHRLSSAATDAYAAEFGALTATRLALRRRLVEAISAPPDLTEGTRVARLLGLDANGTFVVACAAFVGASGADRIDALFAAEGRHAIAIDHGGRTVLVGQDSSVPLLDALHRVAPDARVGTGLSRAGLDGAVASLLDADETLSFARAADRDVQFARDWLPVLLYHSRARLGPLLESGAAVARVHPGLGDAVLAFAESEYSVSACARLLHVHPNTAAYRLERWKHLTGWDVRVLSHLVASLVALADARLQQLDP
jgi:hypothetical protein